ncbi:NAD(P)/FAD-dependent oxidoreductase [Plastoroseomonas hellenica]|uniref:NAD(P)/FAD-dependent oxidoreductase n=1 Tax=Plastoroseomonas hellenica TaxID=2687306 RepID=UPI001BA82CE2|nr:FAD-dependent oxidoreductase [Plastoroseomonas hellenica]MBR0645702.1 FAD-dependent oxidoreductase [Plastoroseomonas hellenica]
MTARKKIIVLGAGIIGACSALRLQRDGHDVTLLDRDEPGLGSSFGNAGSISGSGCIPMALPGMLRNVPKWLFDPLGPLSVRRSYALRAAPWLFQWIRASRLDVVRAAADALHALNAGPADGYRALLSPDQYGDLIQAAGCLHVWRKRPAGRTEALIRELRATHGERAEELGADAIRQLVPALGNTITAGLLLPDSAHIRNPHRLVQALVCNLAEAGGRVVRDEVRGIGFGAAGPDRVVTRMGSLRFDGLVVAAGAFSGRVASELGLRVPLEAERGYHLTVIDPSIRLPMPVAFGDHKFYATPMETGLRLAGTAEFAGLAAAPDWRRSEALLANARRVLPGLDGSGTSVWMGRRPSIPDSVPIIGPSPKHANVVLAFGHGHYGMCGGPGTGRLVADLVAGRAPFIDPTPYSAERFTRAAAA